MCGVCLPRFSLIRWLSGLTSPMGIKGMIPTGATGIERQKYVCTAMPVHFPFRDDIQGKTYIQESRCQGGQQAVEYFCCSSHIASGSFALLSALVWRAGKSLAVKKREIKWTEDQTGDPFGRDLAQIFAEQLLGRTNFCPGWLMSPRASVWLHVLGWAEGGGAMPSPVMPSCIPITLRKWSPETFKVTKAQTLFVDHRTTELEIAERFFSPW